MALLRDRGRQSPFVGVVVFIFAEPYRLGRVVRFFDPQFKILAKFDHTGASKRGSKSRWPRRIPTINWQQSKIAVGAGGITGVGLMNGRQKLLYLP